MNGITEFDPIQYHVEAIADEMCRTCPEMQQMKADMQRKVAQAVSSVRTNTRQNRSSADKYPMPSVNVVANPTGAHRAKQGKK